jgi:TonB-linked SusC/RagA family outer membrane protein
MLIVGCSLAFAQEQRVTGKVTGSDGTPLPGITVQVSGTSTGTATDANGAFNLSVPSGATLIFRGIGFATQSIPLKGKTTLAVTMQASTQSLNELVVTAYGIEKSQKALGYSVSKVNPQILVQHSEPDILKSLQGQVAGVDIRSSEGAPGAATRINIRGNTSFFGDNQPLIIVDGVTYDNSVNSIGNLLENAGAPSTGISSLDPNNIESMTILKGSSAAALYGSRASNGVIIIKTKSGNLTRSKKGMEVTYSSSFSIEKIASIPDYQNEYGAGSAFGYQNANGSWGPRFGTIDSIPTWGPYLTAFPKMFGDSVAYRAYPNNVKDLFRTGQVWENSVSADGGNENTSANVTASLLQHKGYIPNSDFHRASVAVGGVTKLANGLDVHASLSYSNTIQDGGTFGENQVDGVASSFARSLFLARNWDMNLPYEDAEGKPVQTSSGQYDNPKWDYKHNTIHSNTDRLAANIRFDYDILPWFNASYQLGTNTYNTSSKQVIDIGSRAAAGNGQILMAEFRDQTIESNLLLTFTPKLNNSDYSIKAVLGHNVFQDNYRDAFTTGTQIIAPGIYTMGNTKTQTGTSFTSLKRIWGAFADISLSYKSWLFVDLTGRNDWSSTLPKQNRSYFYPGISGSFVFSDALHLQTNAFTFGKIRASWARVGRDADPYELYDVFVVGDPFLGQATASVSSQANDLNLKPEFTRQYEVGVHLEFLESRLGLDVAYYNSRSTDQIAPITLPSSTGYTSAIQNYGDLRNEGVEEELDITPVRTTNFRWDIKGTFTKNKTKVVALTNGVDRISLNGVLTDLGPYIEPGLPYGYIRGSKSVRDDKGNLLIDPATGFPLNDPQLGMIGDPNPDYKAGLLNTFTYKGFFLNALLDYTHGGDIYSVTLYSELGRGVTTDTKDRENSWIIKGVYGDANTLKPILDSKGNEIPNITKVSTNDLVFATGGSSSTFAINAQTEWNIWDASVWHLRELNFGYQLPKSLLTHTPFGSATVSLSARNLWYFAPNVPHASNFDPESQTYSSTTQGFEFSAAPTSRRYGINLKVTF